MQHIRSVDTKQEIRLRKTLWNLGLRYRKNVSKLPGKPDIVFRKYKVVIFVDGDFWHGKDINKIRQQVKTNKDYWIPKIERNIQRDKEVNALLAEEGYEILRFWDSDVKSDLDSCVKKILYCLLRNV